MCLNPFAPKLHEGEESELIITDQKTPEEVLQNFQYAYTFKDSLLYSDLLDSSFVFVFFDPNQGTSGMFVSWGRDVDLQTTGRLFRNFDVIDFIKPGFHHFDFHFAFFRDNHRGAQL